MPIPSLTELTSGQAQPELAFGSGYAGGVPPLDIDFSNTEKRIQEISDAAAKQKKEDKAQFEKNLASKLQSINKFDGILPRDKEELLKLNQQVSAEIIKNSDLLAAGAMSKKGNAERQQKLDMLINDYVVKVEKSKQDKKFEEQLNITLRQNRDYNNEETLSLLDEWRNKPIDERTPFMPIDSGDKELLAQEKEFYKNAKDIIPKTEPVEGDPMSYYSATYGVFDKDKYRNIFKASKGQYYANKYRRSPELQEEWKDKGGFEGYINSIADANMKGSDASNAILIQRVQKSRNESMVEEGRNTRSANQIQGAWERSNNIRDRIDQANANKPQKLTPEQKNRQYIDDYVSMLNDVVPDFAWDVDANLSKMPFLSKFIPSDIVSLASLPVNSYGGDVSKIFKGSKKDYGKAYGVVFKYKKRNGDIMYAPAEVIYAYDKNGEAVVTNDNEKIKEANGEVRSWVTPNVREEMTPEQFAMKMLDIASVKVAPQDETGEEVESETEVVTRPQSGQGKTNTKKRKPLTEVYK